MRGVGLVEIGLPGRGISDDVLDFCFSIAGQRELGVADPERPILDEHFLVFVGAVALVLNLGAKTGDVRDQNLERLVVGVFSAPRALVKSRIYRNIRRLGRDGRSDRLVIGRYDTQQVGHSTAPSPPGRSSAAARQAGGDVAVD